MAATNGPHHWGNGPKPYGVIKKILTKLAEGNKKPPRGKK